jgi:DNA polymerase III alpha subunit (gram-positive type)
MKYLAVDLETTGLTAGVNQIIEIAAILDDSDPSSQLAKTVVKKLPRFHAFIAHNRMTWDTVALRMNWELMREILAAGTATIYEAMLPKAFRQWLTDLGIPEDYKFTMAGKNFGSFDLGFLENVVGWREAVPMRHRFFDLTTIYFNPVKDQIPPSLEDCMKRLGMEDGCVKHRAIEDAEFVVLGLREHWKKPVEG